MLALPTVTEVVEALQPHGVEVALLGYPLFGPHGQTQIACLKRTVENKLLVSEPLPETEHMGWDSFFRLCRQLELDHEEVELKTPRPPRFWLQPDAH